MTVDLDELERLPTAAIGCGDFRAGKYALSYRFKADGKIARRVIHVTHEGGNLRIEIPDREIVVINMGGIQLEGLQPMTYADINPNPPALENCTVTRGRDILRRWTR